MPLINWYPGHIAKAQNVLKEKLKLIDFVLELVDARLPEGSRFDVTHQLLGQKPRVLVFTKADMANPEATLAWLRHYRSQGHGAISLNAQTGQGLQGLLKALAQEGEKVRAKMAGRGRLPRASRVMVVGLPNVGKSSLINKLAKKRRAKVGDKPGITRSTTWIRLGAELELMDTPGIIPPKLDNQELALKLAMIGSVSSEAYDPILILPEVLRLLEREAPYVLAPYSAATLEAIAAKSGSRAIGGTPDLERVARTFMRDLRTGALGPLTLDRLRLGTDAGVDEEPIELEEFDPDEEFELAAETSEADEAQSAEEREAARHWETPFTGPGSSADTRSRGE
jgi:ribosome biogenesis GTPase A